MKRKAITVLGIIMLTSIAFPSCCSIFTSARQDITFVGEEGIKVYDNGKKIATIGDNGETTVKVRKKIKSKELIAKKDGYKPTPVTLESQFNPVACINLLNVFAWGIDLATQKAFKWDNTYIEIEMEEQK